MKGEGMPKVSWLTAPAAPAPTVKELAAVFRAYRKSAGLTSRDIGAAVGCSPENARVQMNKPGGDWNIAQLMRYCDVLGIPYSVALDAATK